MSFRKLVLVVALVLFTCMSGALSPVPALAQSSEAGVKSEVSPPNPKFAPDAHTPHWRSEGAGLEIDIVNRVVLPRLAEQRQITPAPEGAPQQIGFPRAMPLADAQQVAAARLRWTSMAAYQRLRSALPRLARPPFACHLRSRPCRREPRFVSSASARTSIRPIYLDGHPSLRSQGRGERSGSVLVPCDRGRYAGVEIFVPTTIQPATFASRWETCRTSLHRPSTQRHLKTSLPRGAKSTWLAILLRGAAQRTRSRRSYSRLTAAHTVHRYAADTIPIRAPTHLLSHRQSLHRHKQRRSDGKQLVVLSCDDVRGHLSVCLAALSWSYALGHEHRQRLYTPAPERFGTGWCHPRRLDNGRSCKRSKWYGHSSSGRRREED